MRTPNALLSAVLLALAAAAGAADAPDARSLSWLSGHWCSQSDDQFIEEYWLPPTANLALGMARTVKAGKTVNFEFLRVEHQNGLLHLIAVPEGTASTTFLLTASGADWARFENSRHDFPKRVEYRRTDSGLHAEVAGPGENGKERVIAFDYRHCVD